MAFTPLNFTKSWENQQDFPTYEPSEAQVRADLQLLHNETRDSLNRLIAALNAEQAAAQLPIRPLEGLTGNTVQEALEAVYAETKKAASGTLLDGTVTKAKLHKALLERIYGGRLWVSMAEPTEADNPQADFPVGQLWLQPAYTVPNLAGTAWQMIGGRAERLEDGWHLVCDGSMASLTASMLLEHLGEPEDRILVYLKTAEIHSHLSGLSLWLGGMEQDLLEGGGVFETTLDQGGGLELLLEGQLPYEEAGAGFRVQNLTVVNRSAAERTLTHCHPRGDWPAFLQRSAPFDLLRVPQTLSLQVQPGQWKTVDCEVLPQNRGGTGLDRYEAGQLLYADAAGQLRPLAPPGGESFLQYQGKPIWKTPVEAVQTLGALRLMTGTYHGTGSYRNLELPVQPKLLYLHSNNGPRTGRGSDNMCWDNPHVLADGGKAEETVVNRTGGGYSTFLASVELHGRTLTFNGSRTEVGNGSGTTYTWTALY